MKDASTLLRSSSCRTPPHFIYSEVSQKESIHSMVDFEQCRLLKPILLRIVFVDWEQDHGAADRDVVRQVGIHIHQLAFFVAIATSFRVLAVCVRKENHLPTVTSLEYFFQGPLQGKELPGIYLRHADRDVVRIPLHSHSRRIHLKSVHCLPSSRIEKEAES